MIITEQFVKIKWSVNKKYYESILDCNGKQKYHFTKKNDIFLVHVDDLSRGTKVLVKCKCDFCGNIIEKQAINAFKTERHFCDSNCKYDYQRKYGSFNNTRKVYSCDCCGLDMKVKQYVLRELYEGKRKNIFCSIECKSRWESENKSGKNNPNYNSIEKDCGYCGKEYTVPQNQKDRNKYCSVECRQRAQINRIECECFICRKPLMKTKSQINKSKSGNVFCSNKCVGKYNTLTRKKNLIDKVCEICNKPYSVKESLALKSVTCSVECQHEWQSKNLRGKNANNYNHSVSDNERIQECDWCGKETPIRSPYQLKQIKEENKKIFCSKECYREWYAKEWSQSEEWRLECKERAVKMLEDGTFDKTDTEPQIAINSLLDVMGIRYKNEYNCKYVSMDNYLLGHSLMIEVNGTFWHSDPRVYSEINYQRQIDRIKNDKIKHTYILNNYNIEILYLWEEDIGKNIELCEKLILKYIESNGILDNYNSFNYHLDENGKIKLNDKIISPYMEYPIEKLNEIINISEKNRRSMKQHDKWIIFNCEQCGEETEQLISRYNKAKHHFCSHKCIYEYNKGKSRKSSN